jgi:excisionase family DNA binding protein
LPCELPNRFRESLSIAVGEMSATANLLDLKEAADRINVSLATIRRLIATGVLMAVRFGPSE